MVGVGRPRVELDYKTQRVVADFFFHAFFEIVVEKTRNTATHTSCVWKSAMTSTSSATTSAKPNFTHVLTDGTTVEKPSLRLVSMAKESFTTTASEVRITNVPYYHGLTAIFAKEPQNACCDYCRNGLVYNRRYDETVQEKCKYVGRGFCEKCKTGPFVVFTVNT